MFIMTIVYIDIFYCEFKYITLYKACNNKVYTLVSLIWWDFMVYQQLSVI